MIKPQGHNDVDDENIAKKTTLFYMERRLLVLPRSPAFGDRAVLFSRNIMQDTKSIEDTDLPH